jgi:hypothetical protein
MPRRSKVEELKYILASYTLSTQSLVGFEEILRYTQNDSV